MNDNRFGLAASKWNFLHVTWVRFPKKEEKIFGSPLVVTILFFNADDLLSKQWQY